MKNENKKGSHVSGSRRGGRMKAPTLPPRGEEKGWGNEE